MHVVPEGRVPVACFRLASVPVAAGALRSLRSLTCAALLLALAPATAHAYTPAELDVAADAARNVGIATTIASDVYAGRNNGTAGSTAVQALLVEELKAIGPGLNMSQTGDDAYKQTFSAPTGTNLLAVIPGSTLPNEYVMIGAHYDHLGTSGPNVFNGATDNAGGVAIVLAVGDAILTLPTPPQRSVILALWDAEEDGLAGSEFFANNPLVPLSSIKSYVNLDIQGANLLPSLRDVSFAIGSESGGLLQQLLLFGVNQDSPLDLKGLSRVFGQERSDHASFIDDGVPIIFFSDATGSCYHTFGDDAAALDLGKLAEQGEVALRLVLGLTEAVSAPPYVPTGPFATVYSDAVAVLDVFDRALDDLALFSPADQATILNQRAVVEGVVNAGSGAFTPAAGLNVALAANSVLTALQNLPCDGFVIHHVPSASGAVRGALAAALAVLGAAFVRRFVRAS